MKTPKEIEAEMNKMMPGLPSDKPFAGAAGYAVHIDGKGPIDEATQAAIDKMAAALKEKERKRLVHVRTEMLDGKPVRCYREA